jgi:hypothetical protein
LLCCREWAIQEQQVGGFCPWHFSQRVGPEYLRPEFDHDDLGAVDFAGAMGVLRKIGEAIIAGQGQRG